MKRASGRASIADLVTYYRRCLALERQGEASLRDGEFFGSRRQEPRFHPVTSIAATWEEMFSTPAAQKGLQQVKRQEGATLLFAPFLAVFRDMESGERRWEPVGGVYCLHDSRGMRVDPADLFIGRSLGEEVGVEELITIRAFLEQAAREGPRALAQAVLDLIQKHELPLSSAIELSDANPSAILSRAGFWVVGQPSYDRALLEELENLQRFVSSGAALSYLLDPPVPVPPRFQDVVMALANPIGPTLSQAIALAAAMRYPLTVITGPPGTGKTRVIVGLIIHHLLAGQSVLLASRINRAVDAAVELAERLMGKGCILRTGNEQARAQLVETLEELTHRSRWCEEGELFAGLLKDRAPSSTLAESLVRSAEDELRSSSEHAARLCQQLTRCASRLQAFGLGPEGGWWSCFWWRIRWRIRRGEQRMRELRETWDKLDRLFDELDRRVLPAARRAQTNALWKRLSELLQRGGPALRELMAALTRRPDRLRAFERVARAGFPVAVTTLSTGQNLPLSPSVFDTLIVDEASSCDPASLLPLLYRARRVVIVGDPNQLDHVTRERWKRISAVPQLRSTKGKSFEVSFGVSAFALAHRLTEEQSFWLIDHFRCPPPIISFANETFYGGRLRIHTNAQEPQPIMVHRIIGTHQRRGATRSLSNSAQLEAALRILIEWAQQYPERTLGLVAPYRAFIDEALERLHQDPTLETLRNKREQQHLIIGTAHRFQGSEVDDLIFATVAGDNGAYYQRQWIEHPNLFNVAITRPRRRLLLLLSPEFEKHLVLTKRLLRATPVVLGAGTLERGPFVRRVAEELERQGLRHRLGCRYHGDPVDILDDHEQPRWGILLCSWERATSMTPLEALDVWERRRTLEKRGLAVWVAFPLTLDELLERVRSVLPGPLSGWREE